MFRVLAQVGRLAWLPQGEGKHLMRRLIKELDVNASGILEIEFQPSMGRPILSGVEIIESKKDDSD